MINLLKNILNKIYKKYNDNRFFTIHKIFGIKFKIFDSKRALKNLHNHVSFDKIDLVSSIWETRGAIPSLINHFDFISNSQFAWRNYDKVFWLIYLSCLIELNEYDKAKKILNKYLIYFDDDLSEMERFLIVAKFIDSTNKTNKNIKKAVKVYDTLKKNHDKDIFKKILLGKSIAVVGNAPSEIGKSKGAEIDSHDIVIRFNNYKTKGFEKDYGSKTDIWARGSGGNDVVDRKQHYKLITWEADYDHWKVAHNHLDILYRQIEENQLIYNFDYSSHISLRDASGIDFPTTGLVLIWEIYKKLGNFQNVDFYGFSFCQNVPDKYATHYFNDRSDEEAQRRSNVHKIDKETIFLLKLINEVKNNENQCF